VSGGGAPACSGAVLDIRDLWHARKLDSRRAPDITPFG
jgi:hypothetical protein